MIMVFILARKDMHGACDKWFGIGTGYSLTDEEETYALVTSLFFFPTPHYGVTGF